jgi:hypothetical protein
MSGTCTAQLARHHLLPTHQCSPEVMSASTQLMRSATPAASACCRAKASIAGDRSTPVAAAPAVAFAMTVAWRAGPQATSRKCCTAPLQCRWCMASRCAACGGEVGTGVGGAGFVAGRGEVDVFADI